MSADARAFSYRAIVPPLWALVGIAGAELIVVHVVLANWTLAGALILSTLSFGAVVRLVLGIVGMPRLPVLVGSDALVMRAGRIKGARVPVAQVRGVRLTWHADELKRRTVLNCALVSYPNVLVELTGPLPGRRGVVAIAHRLDDPAGFVSALDAVRARQTTKSNLL